MQTTQTGGGGARGEGGGGGRAGERRADHQGAAAAFLFTPLLHGGASALLVLLAALGVTGEDKVVVVELGQLAVDALEPLQLLGRGEDTATFGALREDTGSGQPRATVGTRRRGNARSAVGT